MLNFKAILHHERSWILISVEVALDNESSFTVLATSRGCRPADPKYPEKEAEFPFSPTILLPGESTPVSAFSRSDLEKICESEETRRRVENWEEKIYIYGRIRYEDLIERPEGHTYETSWCCWYIHGRNKSGLVIAGPPQYNSHS